MELVRTVMPPTPTYTWPLLNARAGAEVWLKHENHSPVGAFKLRTATVYIDWLKTRASRSYRRCCCNARQLWTRCSTCCKAAWMEGHNCGSAWQQPREESRDAGPGRGVVEHGEDFQAANEYATELAAQTGAHKVPSFDRLLAVGAGTYALEMFETAPELDTVYVPVGMGSSICGMVAAREALGLRTKIVGVVAKAAPANALSFAAGKVVPHAVGATIADGVACRLPVEDALDVMLKYVERFVEVSEDEIGAAMRAIYEDTHNVAEGAGAMAVAAVLQERDRVAGKRVGAVVSGGNVDRRNLP